MRVTTGLRAITFSVMAGTVVAGTGSAASASTEEAWQEFRNRTEAACRAQLPEGAEAEIAVDPFGSESHGIALLQVGAEVTVCVMDKREGTAELSGPFGLFPRLEPVPAPR